MFFKEWYKAHQKFLIVVFLITLFLSACQETQPKNMLEGTWRNGVIYMLFREDGSYAIAELPGNLQENPSSTGVYTFDGEHLTLFEEEPGICLGITAKYKVTFPEEDQATYFTVQDSCVNRERYLACCLWKRHIP